MGKPDDEDQARSHWRRPRPTPAEQRHDVWIALAVFAGALTAAVLINSMGAFMFGRAPALWEQIVWAAVLTLPLAVRRRYPKLVLFVVGAGFVAAQARANGDNTMPSVALFIATYTVGAWGQDRVQARWSRIGVIVVMFGWLAFSVFTAAELGSAPFLGAAGPLNPVLATVLYGVAYNLLYFLGAYFFGNLAW